MIKGRSTDFPWKWGTIEGYHLLPLLFHIVLEVLDRVIKQGKEIKWIYIGKEVKLFYLQMTYSFVGALNDLLYIPQTQSLPGWSCGFHLQLVQLVGGFWVFFLSHTAPGFQLWFYFHLCMWVVHWGLLMRLPWKTWVCPCEGQVWRWCSCLSVRGSGDIRYSGELAAIIPQQEL